MAKTTRNEFGLPKMLEQSKHTEPIYHPRNLKVERSTYTLKNGAYRTCPFIRLKGHWLGLAGFPIGSRLVVVVRRGCLTIRSLG